MHLVSCGQGDAVEGNGQVRGLLAPRRAYQHDLVLHATFEVTELLEGMQRHDNIGT